MMREILSGKKTKNVIGQEQRNEQLLLKYLDVKQLLHTNTYRNTPLNSKSSNVDTPLLWIILLSPYDVMILDNMTRLCR